MRWLITGASGMVGRDLVAELKDRDEDVVGVSRAELDITDRVAVLKLIDTLRPDVIVNCAAYTKVDDCETNLEHANEVNGHAVRHLAEGANRAGSLLAQLSTDFVFDGRKRAPYETGDATSPQSAYARSKLIGEEAAREASRHLVVRTSWLFGKNGWNFVEAIRKQLDSGREELRVVNDQRGRPTYTPHLADAIFRLAFRGVDSPDGRGTFHYADEPDCTWYEFACEIAAQLKRAVTIRPVTTEEFPRPAQRPSYSVLSTARYERVTGREPRSWKEGLAEYLS